MLALHPSPAKPPRNKVWRCELNGIIFETKNCDALKHKVRTHQQFKLWTDTAIEQEIYRQMNEGSPWLFRATAESAPHDPPWRDWLIGKSDKAQEYCDKQEWIRRASICCFCPHNRTNETDEDAQRLLFIACQGSIHAGLGPCALHLHHNALACLMAEPGKRHEAAPEQCWMT